MVFERVKLPKLAVRCWRRAVLKVARSFQPNQRQKISKNQQDSAFKHPTAIKSIKARRDFLALRNGRKASCSAFLLVMRANSANEGAARVGLTVTKKLGGAVLRNRIRRRLRAASREVFPEFAAADADYVLIARKAAYDRNYPALLDDMKRALLRLTNVPK